MPDSTASSQQATGRIYPVEVPKPPLAILLLLIIVIMVPIELSLRAGPLFLPASRIYLICLTFVVLPRLGELKLQLFDWLFIGHVIWSCVAFMVVYGPGGAIEMSGSYALEFLIVYLAARIYLRDLAQLMSVVRLLLVCVIVSGLVALPEALTGIRYAHKLASAITGYSYRIDYAERMGITRAASLFEHPILYGVFCASSLSLIWFTSTLRQRFVRAPLIAAATWLAASSAPLLTLALQLVLIAVEWLTRGLKMSRDKLLAALAVSFFVFVKLFVGRGLVGVLALMTLNPATAYTRQTQWDNAIDDVLRSPLFGFVPGEYTRPFWLAASIDNWWLLIMMRSGIPSLILLALSALFIWVALARRQSDVPLFINMRLGWGLMMLALVLGAATVTFFGKLQPLFAFYMGFGAALATCTLPSQENRPIAEAIKPQGVAYTRFPGKGRKAPPADGERPAATYSRLPKTGSSSRQK